MNNQNDNQANSSIKDQDVLNQYASSVKPDTDEIPPKVISPQDLDDIKNEPLLDSPFVSQPQPSEKPFDSIPPQSTEITNPEVKESLKEFNATPIDTQPTSVSLSDNLEASKSLTEESSFITKNEPELTPEPEPTIQTETSPLNSPQEDPEEIKQKIDEVLSYNTASNTSNSQSDNPKISRFLKIIFILSLIIFIAIVGALAYFLVNPISKTNSETKTIPTNTPVQSNVTCELNGFIYSLDQSFPSADGCNTCTCVSADNVTCTEKVCADVSTTPATKSAAISTITPTSSNIPKDWKTYTNKTLGVSLQYPVNYNVNVNIELAELYVTEITDGDTMAPWFNILKVNNESLTTFIKKNSQFKKTDFIIGNQKGIRFQAPGQEGGDFIYLTFGNSNYIFLTELSFDDSLFTQILSTFKFI